MRKDLLDPGSALRAVRDDVGVGSRAVRDDVGTGPRAVWDDGSAGPRAVPDDVGEGLCAVWDDVGEAATFVIPAQAGIQGCMRGAHLDPGSALRAVRDDGKKKPSGMTARRRCAG